MVRCGSEVRILSLAQKLNKVEVKANLLYLEKLRGFEREGGRGNGSFPVAEALKPLGFRKFRESGIL